MAQTIKKVTARPASVRSRRHTPRRRPRGVGLAVLAGPPPREPTAVAPDPAWADGLRRVARVALWALPLHAVAYLWLTLAGDRMPGSDPGGWAVQVAGPGYQRMQLLAGAGGWLLGLVAMVALAALLAGLRGRLLAAGGLLAGLAAGALLLPQVGVAAFGARAAGEATAAGRPAAAEVFTQAHGYAATPATVGLVLLTVAWLLFGLAVWCSRPLGRADGMLLLLAAPLLGVAGLYQPLRVFGALLLLAAGIGLAWSGARAVPAAGTG